LVLVFLPVACNSLKTDYKKKKKTVCEETAEILGANFAFAIG